MICKYSCQEKLKTVLCFLSLVKIFVKEKYQNFFYLLNKMALIFVSLKTTARSNKHIYYHTYLSTPHGSSSSSSYRILLITSALSKGSSALCWTHEVSGNMADVDMCLQFTIYRVERLGVPRFTVCSVATQSVVGLSSWFLNSYFNYVY